MTRRILLTWLLVFSLLVQPFVPVFAQSADVNAVAAAYQQTYADYVSSVQAQGPKAEIDKKHEA